MHPCGHALPLSSAFWIPIHFPTDNSEVSSAVHSSRVLPAGISLGLLPASSGLGWFLYYNMHHSLSWVPAILVGVCDSCSPPGRSWAPWWQGPWFTHSVSLIITDHLTFSRSKDRHITSTNRAENVHSIIFYYKTESFFENRLFPLCKQDFEFFFLITLKKLIVEPFCMIASIRKTNKTQSFPFFWLGCGYCTKYKCLHLPNPLSCEDMYIFLF